jgi:hypothetical protein
MFSVFCDYPEYNNQAERRPSWPPCDLRRGFRVGTLQVMVPLNLVQRWMAHTRISTTAIYADARPSCPLGIQVTG